MDEDRVAVDHEGVEAAIVDDKDVHARGAEPGGLEHRRGHLFERMFDIRVAQQRESTHWGGGDKGQHECYRKQAKKLH